VTRRPLLAARLGFTLTDEQREQFELAVECEIANRGDWVSLSSVARDLVVRWSEVVLRNARE